MGCDIHIVLERKEMDSEWVGVWASDRFPGNRPQAAKRDYGFFGEVARVRHPTDTGIYPRNLPKDVSRLSWLLYMQSPTDHHSVSHMEPAEFAAAWRRANPVKPDTEWGKAIREGHEVYDLLGVWSDDEDGVQHRVVFWFDN